MPKGADIERSCCSVGTTREDDDDVDRVCTILTVCSVRRMLASMPSERVARKKRNALMQSCLRDGERSVAVDEKFEVLVFVRLGREDAVEGGGWVLTTSRGP